GAHALAVHGLVRATKDLDVWVRPTPTNAHRVFKALAAYGAPHDDLNEADLSVPGVVFLIGIEPLRIDVLTEIDGVTFDDAWRDRIGVAFDQEPASVLSAQHLLANKRAAGRLQDLADVERLEAILKAKGG
ncbi:MAG: hypothetical protein ACYC2K_16455, partial [Gemmatimonadales bacterium]